MNNILERLIKEKKVDIEKVDEAKSYFNKMLKEYIDRQNGNQI